MAQFFVTGAAGFIASHLVDHLLERGHRVLGYDNFSTGQKEFLRLALANPNFKLVEGDTLDLQQMSRAMQGCEFVFHLAANADVRFGLDHPKKDLEQNTIATFNVLEAMRANEIKQIAFSSTGSVYGEAPLIPTPENAPFPVQTSLYAASKVAGEALIQAYAEGFGYRAAIFRFVSILGERYTHGHVFDFYKQLLEHPDHLKVLGDGTQQKSYLYINDCIQAMLHVCLNPNFNKQSGSQVYNLGTEEYTRVNDSIATICKELNLNPKVEYSGGKRGWVGDNPFIFLDTKKIRETGWSSKASIQDGIVKTLRWLKDNRWVLERR